MKAYGYLFIAVVCSLEVSSNSEAPGPSVAVNAAVSNADNVRKETTDLLISDAHELETRRQKSLLVTAPTDPTVTAMEVFVVRERKASNIVIPKFESPVMRFLKTGTLIFLPGKISTKVSTDFTSGPGTFTRTEFKLGFSR